MLTATVSKEGPFYLIDKPQQSSYLAHQRVFPAERVVATSLIPSVRGVPIAYLSSRNIWPPLIDADSVLKELRWRGVFLVNQEKISAHLSRFVELPPVVAEMTLEIINVLPSVPLALELVCDPEDASSQTLVLYLRPAHIEESVFELLNRWNEAVATRTADSGAWFLIDIDLRK